MLALRTAELVLLGLTPRLGQQSVLVRSLLQAHQLVSLALRP